MARRSFALIVGGRVAEGEIFCATQGRCVGTLRAQKSRSRRSGSSIDLVTGASEENASDVLAHFSSVENSARCSLNPRKNGEGRPEAVRFRKGFALPPA
jgi:hypothetical protein